MNVNLALTCDSSKSKNSETLIKAYIIAAMSKMVFKELAKENTTSCDFQNISPTKMEMLITFILSSNI